MIIHFVLHTLNYSERLMSFLTFISHQKVADDINWVVKRAEQRGYDTPAAFMSSKTRAGINHKEYGVTSEGINVYLDVALRHVLKKSPKEESFTISE